MNFRQANGLKSWDKYFYVLEIDLKKLSQKKVAPWYKTYEGAIKFESKYFLKLKMTNFILVTQSQN